MLRKLIYTLVLASTFAKAQHAPTAMVNTAMNSFIAQCGTRPAPFELYAMNNFVAVNIANGNWAELDRFWLFAQSVQGNSKISLINPTATQIIEVNSPTWTQYRGYYGNGTTSYLNTSFVPSIGGFKYVLNSADFGVYIYDHGTAASLGCEIGMSTTSGAVVSSLYSRYTDNNIYANINQNVGAFVSGSIADAVGFNSARRTASNAIAIWKNGVSQYTGTTASSSIPSLQGFYVGARDINGAADAFSDRKISIAYMGSSSIGNLSLYNSINLLAYQLGFHF